MSKICIQDLKKILSIDHDSVKQQKIEKKKEQLYSKMKSLLEKYFDEFDENSIFSRIKFAKINRENDKTLNEFYVKLDRDDFLGWSAFVPFKPDDNGYNFNARPLQCCKRFLVYAKEKKYLPNIHFEVQNFTVKFTIK